MIQDGVVIVAKKVHVKQLEINPDPSSSDALTRLKRNPSPIHQNCMAKRQTDGLLGSPSINPLGSELLAQFEGNC